MSERVLFKSDRLRQHDQGVDVHSPRPETVVDINTWRPAAKDAVLATYALLPCIGVAIYDDKNRVGHMGHWSSPEEEPDIVEPMFQSVLQTASEPHHLRAWLRGGAADPDNQEYIASIAAARAFVTERLVTAGIVPCDIRWSERPLSVDMWLDCSNGDFMSMARPATFA